MTPGVREADPRRRRRQRLAAGRRVRRRVRAAPGGARRADRRHGDGLRDRRARPRLRDHARLRRAGAARRAPPGRRAGDALRRSSPTMAEFAGSIEDGEVDQPARDGPADGAAVRQRDRRLLRARSSSSGASRARSTTSGLGLTPPVEAAVERALALVARDDRRAAHATPRTRAPDARVLDRVRRRRHRGAPRRRAAGDGRDACAAGAAPGRARLAGVRVRDRRRARRCARARGWSRRSCPARLRCGACDARVGDRRCPVFRCPRAASADVEVRHAARSSRWSRSRCPRRRACIA